MLIGTVYNVTHLTASEINGLSTSERTESRIRMRRWGRPDLLPDLLARNQIRGIRENAPNPFLFLLPRVISSLGFQEPLPVKRKEYFSGFF